jgi:hypothetical protein
MNSFENGANANVATITVTEIVIRRSGQTQNLELRLISPYLIRHQANLISSA